MQFFLKNNIFFTYSQRNFTAENTTWANSITAKSSKSESHVVSVCDPMDLQPARLLYPWDSPGQNTGVGGHALLQGIFPTQVPELQADSEPTGKPVKLRTFGLRGRGRGWDDLGEWHSNMYTIM